MDRAQIDPRLLEAAHKLGLRLEFIAGVGGVWEMAPSPGHQRAVDAIRKSIKPGRFTRDPCACVHLPDVDLRFADGSIKRPDISIWDREPDELDTAVTLVPVAVIEVVSRGYEDKDLILGPPFYLKHGVRDVLVYDPATRAVRHSIEGGTAIYQSPVTLTTLRCGCEVSFP